eukprot:XP_001701572.1 predicted protein [Chlamydomonas reinhardtii]
MKEPSGKEIKDAQYLKCHSVTRYLKSPISPSGEAPEGTGIPVMTGTQGGMRHVLQPTGDMMRRRLEHAPDTLPEIAHRAEESVVGVLEHVSEAATAAAGRVTNVLSSGMGDYKTPEERMEEARRAQEEREVEYEQDAHPGAPLSSAAGDPARKRDTLVDKLLYPWSKEAGTDTRHAEEVADSYHAYVKEKEEAGSVASPSPNPPLLTASPRPKVDRSNVDVDSGQRSGDNTRFLSDRAPHAGQAPLPDTARQAIRSLADDTAAHGRTVVAGLAGLKERVEEEEARGGQRGALKTRGTEAPYNDRSGPDAAAYRDPHSDVSWRAADTLQRNIGLADTSTAAARRGLLNTLRNLLDRGGADREHEHDKQQRERERERERQDMSPAGPPDATAHADAAEGLGRGIGEVVGGVKGVLEKFQHCVASIMKRSRANELAEVAREIEKTTSEIDKTMKDIEKTTSEIDKTMKDIEKTTSEIDKTMKDIEKEKAVEDELWPRARKILEELDDVQAQLQQQQLAKQQFWDKQVDAAHATLQHLRKREEYLRKEEEYLRKEEEYLRKEEEQLRKKKEQLRDKEKELRQSSGAKAAGAEQEQLADSKSWSKKDNLAFFRCFRPSAGVGPTKALPVALYDGVLDKLVGLFSAALKGRGGGGADGVPPSSVDCEMASRLCIDMAESFTDVAARTAAFSDMLSEYLGECIEPHHPIPGSEYNATDGSLLCRVGGPAASSAARLLPVYIQVVKLEIGTQGDPYLQGQRQYQLALANPKLAELVRHTVLPVLFVELVGPHLRVSALASPADATVVCEPLTPYLHLFSMHRFQPDHMICLALLPYPLRPGTGFTDVRQIGAGVYNPLYFAMYQRPPPPLLPAAAGEVRQQCGAAPAAASVVAATTSDPAVAVAVKFGRMSADAVRVHRAWAAAGLAPQVLLEQVLPCGLTMLVMEQLAAEDGWVMFYSLQQKQKRQLQGAAGPLPQGHRRTQVHQLDRISTAAGGYGSGLCGLRRGGGRWRRLRKGCRSLTARPAGSGPPALDGHDGVCASGLGRVIGEVVGGVKGVLEKFQHVGADTAPEQPVVPYTSTAELLAARQQQQGGGREQEGGRR